MFREPTVFIVGAGASAEADLPVGETLKQQIKLLTPVRNSNFIETLESGDALIFDALKIASRPPGSALDAESFERRLAAARRVATALPLAGSIDSLLESYADDADMRLFGKLAIARTILAAESKSRLIKYGSQEGRLKDELRIEDTWYPKLARMIFDGRRPSDGPAIFNNVSVICFNYDRCIESFFFNALRRYFSMDASAARTAMCGLKIVHPYGKVGDLAWQSNARGAVNFGAEPSADQLLSISSQIRIYTEQSNDTTIATEITRIIASSTRAVFLGFGFHQQNLDLLRPKNGSRIFSVVMTSLGISSFDIEMAKSLAGNCVNLKNGYPNVSAPQGIGCKELFNALGLTLKN